MVKIKIGPLNHLFVRGRLSSSRYHPDIVKMLIKMKTKNSFVDIDIIHILEFVHSPIYSSKLNESNNSDLLINTIYYSIEPAKYLSEVFCEINSGVPIWRLFLSYNYCLFNISLVYRSFFS